MIITAISNRTRILAALKGGPMTLMEISAATRIKYELTKVRCRELLQAKKLDRIGLGTVRNRSRFMYKLGTGECFDSIRDRPDLEARYELREQRASGITELPDGTKIGPNGGKVHALTDNAKWHDDGQLSRAYGVARGRSAMLEE